ncbi:MAG: NUDIX domain-containing protein [Bacteroidales bacterium]|nr:NUDIX domain-containing protein [Bacteroidales bacterium]
MYRIHFESRNIVVCSSVSEAEEDAGALVLSIGEQECLAKIPLIFEKSPRIYSLYIPTSDEERVYNELCSEYHILEAAGGVVRDRSGRTLMIRRRGRWDLPKGKMETGESHQECALREVAEETGIRDLTIGNLICVTHHTFLREGKRLLKHTWWYDMEYKKTPAPTPVPQIEEEISVAEWVPNHEIATRLSGSYASIKEVFRQAGII